MFFRDRKLKQNNDFFEFPQIVFIAGFDDKRNNYVAYKLKDYFSKTTKYPTILIDKEACVSNIRESFFGNILKNRNEIYSSMEYLYLHQKNEEKQFIEIVKYLSEKQPVNIIASGKVFNLLSEQENITEVSDFFQSINRKARYLFVERTITPNANRVHVQARIYFEKLLKRIYKNNNVEKIYDCDFNTIEKEKAS